MGATLTGGVRETLFNNNNRITFGGFLAYFVMSAVISPLGLVSGPIAEAFGISLTEATAAFTFLTSGVLIGTLIAIFIFDLLTLRQVILGGLVVICAGICALYASSSFGVFCAALGSIGAACGIELSAAAVVITKLYSERLRASMLLLTDSFYSGAGVVSTWLAGVLLARGLHFSSAYLLAFAACVTIAVIAASGAYPATRSPGPRKAAASSGWPLGVHLIGLGILIYLAGFVGIYSWVPNYAQETLGMTAEASSRIVSRLFLGMFVGQIVMFVLVLRFALLPLVVIYATLSTALTVPLWTAGSGAQLALAMLLLGLATGGLLKTVLTYGTTLTDDPSPRMVSYLIFHAGFGTAISPFLSAAIVERYDMAAALKFCTACYVAMLVLILAARALQIRGARGATESA